MRAYTRRLFSELNRRGIPYAVYLDEISIYGDPSEIRVSHAGGKRKPMKADDVPGTAVVKAPYLWVCGACGKRSQSRYGFDTPGWDESCMLNAVLVVPNDGAHKYLAVKEIPDDCVEARC